jgi:hypothetical protein
VAISRDHGRQVLLNSPGSQSSIARNLIQLKRVPFRRCHTTTLVFSKYSWTRVDARNTLTCRYDDILPSSPSPGRVELRDKCSVCPPWSVWTGCLAIARRGASINLKSDVESVMDVGKMGANHKPDVACISHCWTPVRVRHQTSAQCGCLQPPIFRRWLPRLPA